MASPILFTLPDAENNVFKVAEHLPLIVYFYPKDSTPGCTTEAQEFSLLLPQFQELGFSIVGISRNSVKSHQQFVCKYELNVTLLADVDSAVCRQFDVIKEKNNYGKKVLGIERSTFVLNQQGEIIQEWRKVRAAGHAQMVLDWVRSYQSADKQPK
ncbi:peroxiredoxin [Stenoxybacter acetivorans]|uniref:peroxiredoxin n=1 Tax=Stenoxybacter acetivorans TaxID=422441 RepID=UPI00055F1B4B|nr:peroxiredoxin [Stenoxybacter acetivorans]